MPRKAAVIGAGRVGRSMLTSLVKSGYYPGAVISATTDSAKSLADALGCEIYGEDYSLIPEDTDLIVISVPDDKLETAIKNLDGHWKFATEALVVHTSGLYESDLMNPLSEKGAKIVSVHPAASFPDGKPLSFEGMRFGIEGKDSDEGVKLVNELGGIPFRIVSRKKSLYHAACTLASGYVNVLLDVSKDMMSDAGIEKPDDIVVTLAESAVKGWNDAGISALTGSIVRGDVDSVKKHLQALKRNGTDHDIYRILAVKTVEKCVKAGIIDSEISRKIVRILDEQVSDGDF